MTLQTRYVNTASVAYDFDKFESKQRQRTKKPALVVKKPTSSMVRARQRAMMGFKVATGIALMAAVVITMLYSRAVLTELTQEIDTRTEVLNEELSEATRLSAELESKVSLRNVEEYASRKLGMSTLDKQQITYIDMSEGDKVELTGASPKKTILDRIQLAISNVQEYLVME